MATYYEPAQALPTSRSPLDALARQAHNSAAKGKQRAFIDSTGQPHHHLNVNSTAYVQTDDSHRSLAPPSPLLKGAFNRASYDTTRSEMTALGIDRRGPRQTWATSDYSDADDYDDDAESLYTSPAVDIGRGVPQPHRDRSYGATPRESAISTFSARTDGSTDGPFHYAVSWCLHPSGFRAAVGLI